VTTERLTFEVDIVRGGDARVVSVNGEAMPEFLPLVSDVYARPCDVVRAIIVQGKKPRGKYVYPACLMLCFDQTKVPIKTFQLSYAHAPYFAAWLDRLGIPWTDDLRKAHEAATKKGGES
jgi:hypothetical protein